MNNPVKNKNNSKIMRAFSFKRPAIPDKIPVMISIKHQKNITIISLFVKLLFNFSRVRLRVKKIERGRAPDRMTVNSKKSLSVFKTSIN
jgi:hypothetical protein